MLITKKKLKNNLIAVFGIATASESFEMKDED